ncbi:MAG: Ku protein, partial [Methanomassiliicoccales archaeon]
IEIHEFVDGNQIDGIYLDRPYFVGPGKEKDKPYHLFMEALRSTGRVAIGKFVMREREHLAAIEPYGDGMLLTTLNYAYELRGIDEIEGLGEKPDLSEKEMDLAEQLIERMSSEEFDIARYQDGYMEKLKEAIEGKEEMVITEVESDGTSEENLIDSLRSSLEA